DADPRGAPVVAVEDEDVADLVAVAGNEVRGVRPVGQQAAVSIERGAEAAGVALGPTRTDADPGGLLGLEVVEVDVGLLVGVVGLERCLGLEGDEAAGGRDRWADAVAHRLLALR